MVWRSPSTSASVVPAASRRLKKFTLPSLSITRCICRKAMMTVPFSTSAVLSKMPQTRKSSSSMWRVSPTDFLSISAATAPITTDFSASSDGHRPVTSLRCPQRKLFRSQPNTSTVGASSTLIMSLSRPLTLCTCGSLSRSALSDSLNGAGSGLRLVTLVMTRSVPRAV